MIDFAKVISPIEPEEFFSDYWERKPLIVARNDPDYYRELLTLDDVDYVVSSTDLQYPSFKLVKKDETLSHREYTRSFKSGSNSYAGAVDVERIYGEFQDGATIILQGLHCRWEPLAEFCRNLEHLFGHTFQANIYLTPPAAQGFAPHADTHDVFILQSEGAKRWLIYDDPTPLLLPRVGYKMPDLTEKKPLHEVDLKSGDMIYIPRGFVHEAATVDCVSLHITLGVIVKTWTDVFARAVENMRSDEAFRKSLPVGYIDGGDSIPEEIEAQFQGLLSRFNEKTDARAVMEQISEDFISGRRPLLRGQLVESLHVDKVSIDTQVGKRKSIVSRLRTTDDGAELVFHGKIVRFPTFVSPALDFVSKSDEFPVKAIPGDFQESEKLVLVRRLLREGFLTIH